MQLALRGYFFIFLFLINTSETILMFKNKLQTMASFFNKNVVRTYIDLNPY